MNKVGNKILTGESDGFKGEVIDNDSAQAHVDTSPKYFFVFLVLATVSALLMSWQLRALNADPSTSNLINAGLGAILFTFFSVFIPWFIRSLTYAIIFALFTCLAIISFFANIFSAWIFFGAILYVTFYLVAFYRARQTLENWILIKFGATTTIFAKIFLSGLAIFLALLYGGIYAQNNKISINTHELLVASSAPVVTIFAPGFTLESTVDETIESFARKQLTRFEGFAGLDQIDKELAIEQNVLELRNKIMDVTEQTISNEETVLSYTYALLTKFTTSATEKGSQAFGLAIVVALIALGIIKLAFMILRWPIVLCATIMYYFLRSVEVMKITTEKRRKEIILLK